MYDVGKGLKRFKGLIKFTANKYGVRGHFRMSPEEIEAEGYLTLVDCCRRFPKGQLRFGRYFKRAWNNRLIELRRFGMEKKRQGFEVDLELADFVPAPTISEVWERIKSKADDLMPLLSRDARCFLRELLEPSREVEEFAWREFCRRNKLHDQGFQVCGWNRFRIRLRHIRGALNMTPGKVQQILVEIRSTNKNLWRKRHEGER